MNIERIKKFIYRLGYSTNHKDIGTLYIVYGAIAGIAGIMFLIFILKKNVIFPIILLGENIGIIRFFSVLNKKKDVST